MSDILLKDLLGFIFKPNILGLRTSTGLKLWKVIRIYSWLITINLLVGILIAILLLLFKQQESNIIFEVIRGSPLYAIIYGVIIAPILEELIFRLPLRFKPSWQGPFFLSLSFLLLGLEIIRKFQNIFVEVIIASIFLLISTIIFITLNKERYRSKVANFYTKHYRVVFYFFTLFFGYLHIFNYTSLSKIWFLIPILPLPQIFAGIILGYTRIRLGFKWGIALHMLNNSLIIPITLVYLLPLNLRFLLGLMVVIMVMGIFLFAIITILADIIAFISSKKQTIPQ